MIKTLFEYLPFAFFILTLLVAIVPCKLGVRTQVVAAAVLLTAFSKFLCYRYFGGDAFAPNLPEKLIWVWNALYSAAVIFMTLACVYYGYILLFRPKVPTRRIVVALLAISSALLSARGVWNGIKPPEIVAVELAYDNLPPELDGYRILHLSDLHISSAARRERTEEVVRRANAAGADLIVVTGDLVDGFVSERADDVEPLRRLKAPDGVWFSSGNHEFYYDWPAWKSLYESWGLHFLQNACAFPRPVLALAGVDDEAIARVAPHDYPSLEKTFVSVTNGPFRVLLRHRPSPFLEAARFYGVDLQLSGHTHGGIMPGFDALVSRFNGNFVRGLYKEGGAFLSVSPGAGQWAGFPIRFFNDPTLPLYILRRK